MGEETISINLAAGGGTSQFFDELDRRFDALAARFTGKLAASVKGGGGGSSSGSLSGKSSGGSGNGGGAAGAVAGLFGGGGSGGAAGGGGIPGENLLSDALIGAAKGAGAGLRGVPAGAFGANEATAQAAGIGAWKGALENTVGKIPFLGDAVMAQFSKFESAVRQPTERTENQLASFYGDLAAQGVNVSDKDIQANAARGIEINRRRLQAERRVQKVTEQTAVDMGSVSWGLSQLGI